jgi:tetratricopeptide (TPR) repeat protein
MNRLIGFVFFLAVAIVGCDSADGPVKEAQVESVVEEVTPQVARLDSLSQLLEKSPSNTELLNERAKTFLEVNEVNYALADIGKALLLDSTVAKYYLTISDVYFRLNKPVQCKNALLKAHDLQPNYVEPLYRLAQFELYLGNHQTSINYANDMLRIDARDDRPFMVKALCFKELGDTAKAIHNYLESTTENPDNYDAFVELGVLHWAQNNPLAENYLKSALDIKPDGVDALYALGMQYQQVDKLNEALETYTRILQIDSTYRTAYYNMGYIKYQYLQLYNEALANFDEAVKVDSKYYQAVYMRGLCYEAKGDVARAKQEYSYAIQLNPDYGLAAAGLTRLVSKVSQ